MSDIRETATGTRLALLAPGLETAQGVAISDQLAEMGRCAEMIAQGDCHGVLIVGLLPDGQIEIGGTIDDVGEMLIIAKRLEQAAMRALDGDEHDKR